MNELYVKENGVYCGFITKIVVIDLKGKTIVKDDIDDKNTIDSNYRVDEDNNISF